MYFENKNKFVIFDLEFNAESGITKNRITQFSALVFENDEISELNYYNRNVNYMNRYVSKMTHISIKKCKSLGMSERHLIQDIYNLFKECNIIYAYGYEMDIKTLKYMFKKYELPEIKFNYYDIINDVKKYLCPSKNKLEIAANEYGFEGSSYHNALEDCYAIYHLMKVIDDIKGSGTHD